MTDYSDKLAVSIEESAHDLVANLRQFGHGKGPAGARVEVAGVLEGVRRLRLSLESIEEWMNSYQQAKPDETS
jgi:hypothetical protein